MKRAAGILALVVFALLASGAYTAWQQVNNDPQLADHFASARQAAASYAIISPAIEDRPFIGNSSAPITIIAYLDFASSSTQEFARTLWPQIYANYIMTGKAKAIFKNSLDADDERAMSARWQRAAKEQCAGTTAIESVLESQDLKTLDRFGMCSEQRVISQLRQDISENERYGFQGISPHFVIGIDGNDNTLITGIPSLTQLNDTLRGYETRIGE